MLPAAKVVLQHAAGAERQAADCRGAERAGAARQDGRAAIGGHGAVDAEVAGAGQSLTADQMESAACAETSKVAPLASEIVGLWAMAPVGPKASVPAKILVGPV